MADVQVNQTSPEGSGSGGAWVAVGLIALVVILGLLWLIFARGDGVREETEIDVDVPTATQVETPTIEMPDKIEVDLPERVDVNVRTPEPQRVPPQKQPPTQTTKTP